MKILDTEPNSIAQELEIPAGAELVAFDGYPVTDILDYEYFCAQESFVMTVHIGDETIDFEIEKDAEEELGLVLDREIPVRACKNNCIFCFVAQLPKKERLRKTLKVRDDDYRHSFISGNYVTLTNVSEAELDRIIRLRLSPLYVSVHSTDAVCRQKLLGAKNPPNILSQLSKLKSGGIKVHTQVVYCPGLNEDLAKTIEDLLPVAESLAVVPVGLTRDANPDLKPVSSEDAMRIVQTVEAAQAKILPERGTRFVFAADEFYVLSGLLVPPAEAYEDFSQIENGIGLLAAFNRDFEYALSCCSGKIDDISIATGKSAYAFIRQKADILMQKYGGTVRVYAIENNFFGKSVTVAGLVVGRDIMAQLSDKPLGKRLLLPRIMLREFGGVFLDDTTVPEVSQTLKIPVQIIAPDGESFVRAALNLPSQTEQ